MQLPQQLAEKVAAWRAAGYPHPSHPAITEILDWLSGRDAPQPPFLRIPQVRALETYWYLRLVEATPSIPDIYAQLAANPSEHLESLGLSGEKLMQAAFNLGGVAPLLEKIKADDAFVKQHKLESLRETLTLDYPSYILALAMGAGKTMLIGAIIATEFAMAQEYPEGNFVHNALVFAPGKTIIESLRELATMPFEGILPPRMYKPFAASVKLTFTRDGSPDIDVIPGSHYNIVVTNTEKIRIQKAAIRKGDLGNLYAGAGDADRLKQDVANRRLQRLAQLPHLGVFSDEAHHTYGQSMDAELKKVRKTVDYLAAETNVVCVVNTTGTPYYNKQPLLDVVYWYGLSQGIADGYLKPVSGNIESLTLDDIKHYVAHVVGDFLKHYGGVTLPNGAKAKLALYFPQTDDLEAMRPVVEAALVANGHAPSECLANHSHSPQTDVDAFNRLNDPSAPHRIILLVNRGTEGWNCPSLFACALARNLQSSSNFVLQAATRCLRQVPGNTHKAKIYLSQDNYAVLDRQLQETYGESLTDLNRDRENLRHARIVLLKENIPPLLLKRRIVRVRRVETSIPATLKLLRPTDSAPALTVQRYELAAQASSAKVMRELGDALPVEVAIDSVDTRSVAADLCARYRLPLFALLDALHAAYGDEDVPLHHLDSLAAQLEDQVRHYETESEDIEVALALVRPEGFAEERDAHGEPIRTAEITYHKDKADRLWNVEDARADYGGGFGFHYSPYNFDAMPEKDFLAKVLSTLKLDAADIEDVYFTGALGRNKTDFVVEYKGQDGRWHPYSPDFLIRRKPAAGGPPGSGKLLIVEIKQEHNRKHPIDGEQGAKAMAVREWARINSGHIAYEMLFTDTDSVANNDFAPVRTFLGESA